jgi:hypothetical protein
VITCNYIQAFPNNEILIYTYIMPYL